MTKARTPKKAKRPMSLSSALVLGGIGLLVLSAAIVLAFFEPEHGALCATSVQRSAARSRLEASPTLSVAAVAESLEESTATTLDAFPEDRRVGVSGSMAPLVWESLRQWPGAVVDLIKGGADFEITTSLPPLHSPKGSGQFVVGGQGEALNIRLRAAEVGAIYAFIGRLKAGDAPSVVFLDQRGAVLFKVVPPPADTSREDAIPAYFMKTFRMMGTLPGVCDAASD